MEESLFSQELTEQKSMTVTPQDSVMSLLNQARWGDGSAYIKLADCYRDGFGVKKDFFDMINMAFMASFMVESTVRKITLMVCLMVMNTNLYYSCCLVKTV